MNPGMRAWLMSIVSVLATLLAVVGALTELDPVWMFVAVGVALLLVAFAAWAFMPFDWQGKRGRDDSV